MVTNRAFHFALILSSLVVCCSSADLKVNGSTNSGLDARLDGVNSSNSVEGRGRLAPSPVEDVVIKNIENFNNTLKENLDGELVKSNSSGQSEMKEGEASGLGIHAGSNEEVKVKEDDKNQKGGSTAQTREKDGGEAKGDDRGSRVPFSLPREELSRVEECDPHNKCIDEKKKLVACIKVPGNESPEILLLIVNKEKGPINVVISAPDFVQLEATEVQLQENEDKKVKGSVRKGGGGGGSQIVLKEVAGNGSCLLDLKDVMDHTHSFGGDPRGAVREPAYPNYAMLQTPTIAVVSVAAFVLLVASSSWLCLGRCRRRGSPSSPRYRSLALELPVSGAGGRTQQCGMNEEWDNGWDVDWEDEEAVSAMPVASKRSAKDGWMD